MRKPSDIDRKLDHQCHVFVFCTNVNVPISSKPSVMLTMI